jgi:hypothetical protein
MPIWIGALAIDARVLGLRESGVSQAVRGRETTLETETKAAPVMLREQAGVLMQGHACHRQPFGQPVAGETSQTLGFQRHASELGHIGGQVAMVEKRA